MDYKTQKIHEIALSLINKVGPALYRSLLNEFDTAKEVFEQTKETLAEHTTIKSVLSDILAKATMERAEKEYEYCIENGISILSHRDSLFPQRLNFYDNTPAVLYYKGVADLNALKIVSIVGTRKPSEHGKIQCAKIVEELRAHQCIIVSGLAYGIDVAAHKAAVDHKLPTIGVVAHGHDDLYPSTNANLVKKFMPTGGLLTEFPSGTEMLPKLFPMRNRIVAAMSDAVIVVESARRGGSLITAEFGNEYNKDVFAVPGRPGDKLSEGCNLLIKSHRAHMYESVKDLEYIMRWNKKKEATQGKLFVDLSEEEKAVINTIRHIGEAHVDTIAEEAKLSTTQLASVILNLELKSLIKSIPGKRYICT